MTQTNKQRYQDFIDDLSAHLATMSVEECAMVAAWISTAETRVLARIAEMDPANYTASPLSK